MMKRAPHVWHRAVGAAVLSFTVGCSPLDADPSAVVSSTRIPIEIRLALPTFVDEQGRAFIVDTGTPRSLIGADALGLAEPSEVAAVERTAQDWRLLATWGVARAEVLVVPQDELRQLVGSTGFAGIIGADLLRVGGVATLYLQAGYLMLGRPDFIAERTPVADVHSSLVGQGEVCWGSSCFAYAPSRWIVDVSLEGRPMPAMVDTGAALLTVIEDVVDADRPATVEVIDDQGVLRTLSRVHALDAGELHVVEPVVDLIAFTNRFVRLATQVGRPVDVLLGTAVLEPFIVVFDYDQGRMELYPVQGTDPAALSVPEPLGVSFGLAPQPDGQCYRVNRLKVDGEAMMAGLALGDCVLEVDGITAEQRWPMPEIVEHLLGSELGEAFTMVVEDDRGGDRTLVLHTERFVPRNR